MFKKFTIIPTTAFAAEMRGDPMLQKSVGYARAVELAAAWYAYASLRELYHPPAWLEREAPKTYPIMAPREHHFVSRGALNTLERAARFEVTIERDGAVLKLKVLFYEKTARKPFNVFILVIGIAAGDIQGQVAVF